MFLKSILVNCVFNKSCFGYENLMKEVPAHFKARILIYHGKLIREEGERWLLIARKEESACSYYNLTVEPNLWKLTANRRQ